MKRESIISFFDSESIEATEFRRLYSHITNANQGAIKSVMVTSSIVEEGKSTVASLLALTIAQSADKKILLLDTDLRRPMIDTFFKMPLNGGLVDILEKKLSVKDAIKKTPVPGLSIITAGQLLDEPTNVLKQHRLREIFEELKFYFDFIVVDVPPIIPVSDPLLIAPEVDGVLLTIRAGKTPKDVVKRAVNFLKNSNINVLGIVVNNIEEVLPYYYRSKYYAYRYYVKSDKSKQ